jgi:hypothetical protein
MDRIDRLQAQLDALTQQTTHWQHQTHALAAQTRTLTRQLRWWRGLACGLAVLGLLGWGLPLGLAREDPPDKEKGEKGLAQRVAALEQLLQHFSREQNDIFITGANLHIVNGLGSTDCIDEEGNEIPDCPNGLGNLIVGYNEPRPPDAETIRTGSHNVVVGQAHNFSRFGGLVVGTFNEISGDFASVSGGGRNTASGEQSSVSGGGGNTASNFLSSVSGGIVNTASGSRSFAAGGFGNTASGEDSSVIAGDTNTASGHEALVSGGQGNTASGEQSSVNGGQSNTASGLLAVVSGGFGNTASGDRSSVSGGQNITQDTDFGWAAGSEADEVVVGNVRSP